MNDGYKLTLQIYPSKINILTTFKTIDKVTIMGIDSFITNEYKSYPIIDLEMDKQQVGLQFIDSLQVFNGMLKALGGDYDGDSAECLSEIV